MKKVMFVATVVKTHINSFHLPFLEMFKKEGWQTSVCARNDFENKEDCIIPNCDKYYDMPFERFPFKSNNLKSFFALRKLIKKEKFDIVHCHTPTGGVLARLACVGLRKKGTRVMYTAHGFHFYKGAPLVNWLIYYPIEWFCSFFADDLITINREDYELAKKHMHSKHIRYVPGVGINTNKFALDANFDKDEKKKELGLSADSVVLLSVGELTKRKNHEVIIRALSDIDDENIHYLIAGSGEKTQYLENLVKELQISHKVHFLGFRSDIAELCNITDIYCFPSLQEGLPVALMEAMSVSLPCIASKIRGNTDLIQNNEGGYLCNPTNVEDFRSKIALLCENREMWNKFGEVNRSTVKQFDMESVLEIMNQIYLKGNE